MSTVPGWLWALLVQPVAEFGFMQRALTGCLALSVSAAPMGVFLMLRRMSLTGDAMAHGILPGATLGYLVAGLSLGAMTVGGMVAGFHALGTLMAVGLMVLPAAAARFWARDITRLLLTATALGLLGSVGGLMLSYHTDLPAGPVIVVCLGTVMLLSLALGPFGLVFSRLQPATHRRA